VTDPQKTPLTQAELDAGTLDVWEKETTKGDWHHVKVWRLIATVREMARRLASHEDECRRQASVASLPPLWAWVIIILQILLYK
jgi:hypothetical protein